MNVSDYDPFGDVVPDDDEVSDEDLKFLLRALIDRLNARYGVGEWRVASVSA